MKRFKLAVLFVTFFAGLMTATSADARWRHHHARVGVFIGAPIIAYSAWPRPYYPAPLYYPGPLVASPPQYIEQTPPAQSSSYWYYCRESQAYYPYVQSCPSPWQPVAPTQ